MTITLDDRPEIPLHPLDLTAEPPQSNQAQYCIGLIQTADSQLSDPDNSLGDIILGVPFLRSVYTVMAYTAPNANGSFSPVDGSNQTISPRLGLLSLTNPTVALQEFNTVRVLDQPISGGNSSAGSASRSPSNSTVSLGGKKLSVGIVVLIGILSFFVLCCVLFAIRWIMFRRKYRKAVTYGDIFGMEKSSRTEVFMLTKTISSSKDEKSSYKSGEAALTGVGVKEERILSDSSDEAVVEYGDDEFERTEVLGGVRESGTQDGEWLPITSGDNIPVQYQQKVNYPYPVEGPDHLHLSSPSPHPLTFSDPQSPVRRVQVSPHDDDETEPLEEFDVSNVRTSMAGVGTASRTGKTYLDLRDLNTNSGLMTRGDNGHLSFISTRT